MKGGWLSKEGAVEEFVGGGSGGCEEGRGDAEGGMGVEDVEKRTKKRTLTDHVDHALVEDEGGVEAGEENGVGVE